MELRKDIQKVFNKVLKELEQPFSTSEVLNRVLEELAFSADILPHINYSAAEKYIKNSEYNMLWTNGGYFIIDDIRSGKYNVEEIEQYPTKVEKLYAYANSLEDIVDYRLLGFSRIFYNKAVTNMGEALLVKELGGTKWGHYPGLGRVSNVRMVN